MFALKNRNAVYLRKNKDKGSDFYACDVFVGYDNLIYWIWAITPQENGEKFTSDILNKGIETTDKRIQELLP